MLPLIKLTVGVATGINGQSQTAGAQRGVGCAGPLPSGQVHE
jgi:hypothetical protein